MIRIEQVLYHNSFRARVVLVPLQREFEGGERANKKDAEDAAAEIAAIFLERQLQGRHKHKTDLEIACASPCSPAPIVQNSAAGRILLKYTQRVRKSLSDFFPLHGLLQS